MRELYINLPTITEDWVEARLTEFSVEGITEFRGRDKSFWSEQFKQRYNNVDWDNNALQQHNIDCEVLERIPEAVKSAFKEHDAWGKHVNDMDSESETYNDAIKDAIDMVAELYAIEWAKALRCKGWWN